MRLKFRAWILNLDIWGSFEPLNPTCYDIQTARAAAFTKLVQMRRRLKGMIEFWDGLSEESGSLIARLLAQIELIDFYLSKIEFYLAKKQQNLDAQSSYPASQVDPNSPRASASVSDFIEEDTEFGEKKMAVIREEDDENAEGNLAKSGLSLSASKFQKRRV